MMAEYIVDTTDGIYNARTTGELTRCRDCVGYTTLRRVGQSPDDERFCKLLNEAFCGFFRHKTTPDGYCAWAERRG